MKNNSGIILNSDIEKDMLVEKIKQGAPEHAIKLSRACFQVAFIKDLKKHHKCSDVIKQELMCILHNWVWAESASGGGEEYLETLRVVLSTFNEYSDSYGKNFICSLFMGVLTAAYVANDIASIKYMLDLEFRLKTTDPNYPINFTSTINDGDGDGDGAESLFRDFFTQDSPYNNPFSYEDIIEANHFLLLVNPKNCYEQLIIIKGYSKGALTRIVDKYSTKSALANVLKYFPTFINEAAKNHVKSVIKSSNRFNLDVLFNRLEKHL